MQCKKAHRMRQRYVYITIKIKGNCPVTAAAAATRLISSHLDECQNQPSHSLDQLYSSLSLTQLVHKMGKVRRNEIAFSMPFDICPNQLFTDWETGGFGLLGCHSLIDNFINCDSLMPLNRITVDVQSQLAHNRHGLMTISCMPNQLIGFDTI